ncbi:MAG: MBL fold metallo-hydrolase [Bacteroidales bacterium]|nr:MBL fold metallo-hydrolase [Bacteroidales bacterium]
MNSYKTPIGDLQVEVFGHSSVLFRLENKRIYLDPYSDVCSFVGKEPADLILITHNHYDHYDKKAFSNIQTSKTIFIVSEDVPKVDNRYIVLRNEEACEYEGIHFKAVPSYNIKKRRADGSLFHPRGLGNGYIMDFGGYKIYIAGDTEFIPEMRNISNIEIAFLPKDLPYTMSDEEFIMAANIIKPRYLYPYHYFDLDVTKLKKFLDLGITLIDK